MKQSEKDTCAFEKELVKNGWSFDFEYDADEAEKEIERLAELAKSGSRFDRTAEELEAAGWNFNPTAEDLEQFILTEGDYERIAEETEKALKQFDQWPE